MLDIHSIMHGLATKRPVFHDEKDLRENLASLIRDLYPGCETGFEFNPYTFGEHRVFHDVFLKLGMERTVIELKYPTESVNIEHEGEQFELKESGLDEHGYYNCVKDISRLEQTLSKRPDIQYGIFVLLTHRPSFWKETRPSAGSAVFSLHEGRKLEGKLAYPVNSRSNPRPPINLCGSYELRWRSYSNLSPNKFHQFRYLAVKIGN